ncbi:MAG: FKBP-type peptidyl-prolyl cis-trans isomerase [Alphaproteobacteria bacterium]
MFFRKRRRRKQQDASWMKWLLAFFVLYAVFIHQKPAPKNAPDTAGETVEPAKQDLSPTIIADNLSSYKEKIFPSRAGALRIRDMTLGSGIPAVCGQEVTVTYNTFYSDGKPYTDTAPKDKPSIYIIGEKKMMPVFEHGVIGMQPGGERSVYAPPNYAYGVEGFKREDVPPNTLMRFDISLISTSPALPNPDTSLYRITYVRQGVGIAVICGERIKAHVTVWGMDGKKLFSSKDTNGEPLQFTLGLSEVIVGLEQGVIGMTSGEIRTIIIPPEFQKPLRKDTPDIKIPLPANQTVLVDVERVQ